MYHVTQLALGVVRQFLKVCSEKQTRNQLFIEQNHLDICGPYCIVLTRYDHKATKAVYDLMF